MVFYSICTIFGGMNISDILLLNAGFARHNADWNYPNVNSPFTRMYYVTEGSASVEIDGIVHKLSAHNMYMIPAFTEHTDICDSIFNHYYIHIFIEDISGLDIVSTYEFPLEIEGKPIDELLFKYLCEHNQEMILKYSDPKLYDNQNSLIECVNQSRRRPIYSQYESTGIIYQLLGRFIKDAKPKYQISDPRIEQSLKHINTHFAEIRNVDELAEASCLSSDHFIRLFKREVGITPAHFIIKKKMNHARLMLASENQSPKEIAYSLGYDDISYFFRLFKQYTGFTPMQYRKSFNDTSVT